MMIYKKRIHSSIMRPACLFGDRRYGETSDLLASASREADPRSSTIYKPLLAHYLPSFNTFSSPFPA